MTTVQMTVEGVPAIRSKFQRSRYQPAFRDFHVRTSQAGALAGRAAAPRFTGALAAGINAFIEPAAFTEISGVASTAPHAAPVIGGSSPHYPPPDALQAWAEAKGFGDGGGFIVARAISMRGTKPHAVLAAIIRASRLGIDLNLGRLASAIRRVFESG